MRHGKKHNHLGRTTSHRKAMMANMASSLIEHKRITTTLAKAKALRVYVEPILTKAKSDNTHSRRTVFAYLQSKDAVTELFRDVAVKIADRPGGYTRIIKMENRLGDNAEMALIELVDYNTVYGKEAAAPAKKATRRRGGSGAGKAATPAEGAATAEVTPADDATVVEDAPVAATAIEETPATETPKAEGNTTEAVATEEAPATERTAEEATDKEDKAEKGE